jgi:hypothetical protein
MQQSTFQLPLFTSFVLLVSVTLSGRSPAQVVYSGSAEYNSTSGYKGWSYWDSLGHEMVWDATLSRWSCAAPPTQGCYWTSTGGQPGPDRNVIRRWTAPGAGSARITGVIQKKSNFCNEKNVAVGKVSTQSSVAEGGLPSRGNDGNVGGDFSAGSVLLTNYEAQPWYQIDLGQSYLINRIEIWNRSDGGSGEPARTKNFNVMTSGNGTDWTTINVPGQAGWLSYGAGVGKLRPLCKGSASRHKLS